MEAWFHATVPKVKVRAARKLIGQVIDTMQECFPRRTGQGWNVPKVHGLSKIQTYMCLFGSGINFYGGTGESNHKVFVKDAGANTQKRSPLFSSQTANHYYQTMLVSIADSAVTSHDQELYVSPSEDSGRGGNRWAGEYKVDVIDIGFHQRYSGDWTDPRKRKKKVKCVKSKTT